MAQKKRKNTLIYVLVVAVVALVAIAVITRKARPRGEKVIAEKVEKRTIKELVSASGKVFPITEVNISSDVAGEIVELYVEEGDSVVYGQVLAKIDPDAFQSQVERGEAAVKGAKAQLANARAQVETFVAQKEQILAQLANAREVHDRNTKLFADGVISEADFQTSLSNLRSLEANLKSAEANIRSANESVKASQYSIESSEATLRELNTSLKRTTIYAPVSGIISLLNVEKGERVVGTNLMGGTEMMRIANLNAMEVQVEVSENDIPRVAIGDVVDVEVDAYVGRTFKGKVRQIANSALSASGVGGITSLTTDQVTNFIVTIDIDPASYADLVKKGNRYPFRPGMSASVEINTAVVEDVLSLPIQAVTTREDENKDEDALPDENILEVVFVVLGDTVGMREVQTGIQDDKYIEVLSGLEEGMEVVTGPYAEVSRKLKEGDAVRVVKEDELYK